METIETNDGHFHRCKWLIENAQKIKSKILDVGVNDGFLLRDHILRENLDVVEVDIQYLFPKEYKNKIKFVKCDAHYLPFKDNSFNCTILGDMLEHVKDPVQVIKDVCRVSKSVYITVPNEWEWGPDQRPFQFIPHIRYYSEKSLREDLRKADISEDQYKLYKINGGGWSFWCVAVCR